MAEGLAAALDRVTDIGGRRPPCPAQGPRLTIGYTVIRAGFVTVPFSGGMVLRWFHRVDRANSLAGEAK